MRSRNASRRFGFTVVELLIVVALVAVVLTLAAPSFREMIELRRLRSISAQVVTDVQFARSEAASRQRRVYITFGPPPVPAIAMSCYVIHTCASNDNSGCICNCAAPAGSRCVGNPNDIEVRTVQVPTSSGVKVNLTAAGASLPKLISFDPATGGMLALTVSPFGAPVQLPDPAWIDTSLTRASPPTLRTVVNSTGRPSVCAPGTPVSGTPAC